MKIHYFNPGHETAVLNASPYYTAPANIATMQKELAFLPAWYGNVGDLVLVDNKANEYYNWLTNNLPHLPRPIETEDVQKYNNAEISLWGISPQSIHLFKELESKYALDLDIPEWNDNYLDLNSRQTARDCLIELAKQIPLISESIIPHFYTQLEDISKAVDTTAYQLLAKAPYSSSGRGLLWLPVTGLTQTENQILHGIIKKQGSVSIEPALDKHIDFAMEFISGGNGDIQFVGYSLFHTNKKGGYEYNYIDSQKNIESILSEKIPLFLINTVKENLIKILSEKYASLYKGCIGVDMLIYKESNEFKLHPCLEINMRYNMGYLAYFLKKNLIDENSKGKFCIDFQPQFGETYKKHLLMEKEFPVSFKDKKIQSGYFPLVPICEDNKYRAYLLIENTIS